MTKVAFVAHWDWVLHNFRLPVARALRERGCDVVLVSPSGRYVDGFASQGFRWVEWPVGRRTIAPWTELRAVRALTDIYRSERPDAVHHFTIKPNIYGSLAARRAEVRTVINTFSGMGFVFSSGPIPLAMRAVLVPVMRRAFKAPDVWTIFQNDDDRRAAVARRLVPVDRTRVIEGSGVDVDAYTPAERGSSDVVVLMAARLIREKGVEDFVEAARIVRGKGLDVRFAIAGEPDTGNPSSIPDERIEAWRSEGVVDLLGHRSDMATVMSTASIAVLPTYYPEGVPRFLLEAAASGLPLVATDSAPCRVIVRDGVNGYLVPPRDPERLAAVIERLADDAVLRSSLGRESRRIALERFDERMIVDEYLTLYRELGVIS